MKKHLPTVLMLACAAAFAFGVAQLFKLRFEAGDVYPEYSSLRADPLGTMALYESLEMLPGISVRRDHSSANQLPDGRNITYLHLAARTYDWNWLPEETWKEIDTFLLNGGRLTITFFPEGTKPRGFFSSGPQAGSEKSKQKRTSGDDKSGKPAKPGKKQKSRREGERPYQLDSLKERWGVQFGYEKLEQGDADAYAPASVQNRSNLPLPDALDWHTSTIFTNLDESWRTLYARGTNPVVIERRFGKGTVVMATDSYFLSNEAMRQDRHADLLAWLVGPNKHVVFDEAHFRIIEEAGVATLIRKYRLHGLAAGLLVLAALFIWKNSVSFVPPQADEMTPGHVAGKDAAAGFVNLLRRNIPAREILKVCFAEWTKTLMQGKHYTIAGVDQAQAVMQSENALLPRERDPVGAYRKICEALNRPAATKASKQ